MSAARFLRQQRNPASSCSSATGSKTHMVGIMARNAGGAGAGNGGAAGPGPTSRPGGISLGASLQSVARLMAYGYTSGECERALLAEAGDERAAHVRLYAQLAGGWWRGGRRGCRMWCMMWAPRSHDSSQCGTVQCRGASPHALLTAGC